MNQTIHFNEYLKDVQSSQFLIQSLSPEKHQVLIDLINTIYTVDSDAITPINLKECIVNLKNSVSMTELYLLGLKNNS